MPELISNPILPGFHPDPCILRVGDDYYIATSTFEWWPGVRIFHSRDLVHWRLAAAPLRTHAQVDLSGVPSSGGIWAPGLSHARGSFHLVFTRVTLADHAAGQLELRNYHVHAHDIAGPWSAAVPLNESGFDPSLFHDDDGRSWLVNMLWHNDSPQHFEGIALQEFDCAARQLLGEPTTIFRGTELGSTEGPQIIKRNGTYYLVTAEGGTSYGHAVTVARAKTLTGPYEVHPDNPMLTSADDTHLPIQKAGHGSLVETRDGEWYLAHLGARPLEPRGSCPLGRETFLQKIRWDADDWPRLAHGGRRPATDVPAPNLPPHAWPIADADEFAGPDFSLEWNARREPISESWASLRARPGWLRLRGRNRLGPAENVSLVARRLTSIHAEVEVTIEVPSFSGDFEAGLAVIYDDRNWTWFGIRGSGHEPPHLFHKSLRRGVEESRAWRTSPGEPLPLRLDVAFIGRFFSFKRGRLRGPLFNLGELSDEACGSESVPAFTGCFVGLYAAGGNGFHADFSDFVYRVR